MSNPSRRDFLKQTVVGAGALGVASLGCSGGGDQAQMSIARWKKIAKPPKDLKRVATKLTERAIKDLGGMSRFVNRGDVVWIKPNIGFRIGPEFAANTNPDVVATLVRLCFEAGAKEVKVGDNSCYGADGAYPLSGIEAAAKEAGAEVVYLDLERFEEVEIGGEHLDTWPLYPDIIDSDLVINVPIVKHHPVTRVTVCLKNYMGVAGGDRNTWHEVIDPCLCDLTAYMKPRLSVVDAVRVLKKGPMGGDLDDVELKGVVAAGTDPVALDALGAELLGLNPIRVRLIRAAQARGLGRMDYKNTLVVRETEIG